METDVVVVGAGHNGLVAAIFLLRAGLRVRVIEAKSVVGGAARTEYPFAKAPNLPQSTGAYLLGVMPPELLSKIGIDLPLMRRDPHYFLPTEGDSYVLFGSDRAATKAQFEQFFSPKDWAANEALVDEIGKIRDDIAPTWLEEPLTIEETADKYVRPELRTAFVDLCRGSVGAYIERFGFQSDLVKAMYAVTDGFSGLFGTWDTPGTGMNFLVHNMCRLPGSDGTWMIVQGGMGTITGRFAEEVRKLGGQIDVNVDVTGVVLENGITVGVTTSTGEEIRAKAVVMNADPFRMRDIVGKDRLPAEYNARLDGYRKDGSTMKVNLALSGLPKFKCLPEDRGQYGTTTHLLPPERDVLRSLRQMFDDVKAGKLPEFPTIEWYWHSTVDKGMTDEHGRISSALFVQWVPYDIAGSSWEAEEAKYVQHLLSICDRFAPGTSELVVDTFPLAPPGIEKHFGITRGHIHHVDNSFGFSDRLPYATPIPGLYSSSAGTHPAGSVVGCAGHNAAHRVIRDLGIRIA